ncbi:beta strand repeat-containing protein [Haloferula sp. A504]|uniref:beta strand repeat-containing protein n=1 Tax=Haloferula sp. A504 TaxID=3373601 RepID=UPI0031C0553D|nr:choice-of-anchor D domain-containing protein [Verrucomicrobiaceae bacterium E54]
MKMPNRLLLSAIVAHLVVTAPAAELALEPFNGTAGTPLSGTGGGTGWAAASTWSGPSATTYSTGNAFIASGTNSVGVVTSSDQSAALTSGNDHARTLGAVYTVGNDTGAGEYPVLYLSFLLENPGPIAAGHAHNVRLRTGTTDVLTFGKRINARWVLEDSDQTVNFTTNTGSSNLGNWFAVVKLEYDGTDTVVTGYLAEDSDANLDLTNLASYARTGSVTIPGKASFDSVYIESHNTSSAKVDEIRIGDDLANVSATPDPLLVVDDPATFTTADTATDLDLALSNAGATNDLTITAVTPGGTDGSALSVDPLDLPLTIPVGGDDILPITFTPFGTYQASYSATLEIVSNESASPRTINIDISNNPDPWIQAAATVNLSNNGAADSYSIPVSNIGVNETLNISGVTVDGPDAETVSGLTFPAAIDPGLSGNIDFTFTPDLGLGAYDFTLTVASDDPATPSTLINVTVTVAEPLISVAIGTLDFGLLANNPGPVDLPVTITNTGGTLDLNISNTTAITGSGTFSILSPALPVAISPGGSTDLVVRFDPGTAGGRFSGTLTIQSDDSNSTVPTVALEAFVDPAGTVVSRFDFDPNQQSGTVVDVDGSSQTAWTTGDFVDEATGTGAIGASNQATANRDRTPGLNGTYLNFSCARESDAQTPVLAGGNNESTWTTFTVTPDAGGGEIDFTGGAAVVDTYANTDQGSNTAADWTLYYSTDGGTSWTSLGTQTGQATAVNGTFGPLGLSWDLTPVGIRTAPVDFILDPVATGATNGITSQRGVGFDNLVITAGSVTPGAANFASWASGFGIPNDPDYDGSDFDGIPALVEYALGLSPLVAEGSPGTLTGGVLSFSKGTEAVTNGDITYAIEESDDLGVGDAWDTVTPDVNDASEISYTLPIGQPRIFARLAVTQNP